MSDRWNYDLSEDGIAKAKLFQEYHPSWFVP